MILTVWAPDGVPEVAVGDDLAALLPLPDLADGDIVAVTSKVVSKAEGRVVEGDRAAAVDGESVRVVARRGATVIVRTPHGLTLAAAGIDASNVEAGRLVLLPVDPDASARRLRAGVAAHAGVNVGVIVTDTAGRPWRQGQTDIAIGAAGVVVMEDFVGRVDPYGNPLQVTAPAVADELAGVAELAQGKLGRRPFAVIRGRPDLVLAAGDDGRGAAALVRGESQDLFGFGAREAVVRALAADPADRAVFGEPMTRDEVSRVVTEICGRAPAATADGQGLEWPDPSTGPGAVRALALAAGWDSPDGRTLVPAPRFPPTT